MNKILSIVALVSIVFTTSCKKDDSTEATSRPFGEVYLEDKVKIENYMNTHYIDVVKNGDGDVTSVTFGLVDADHPLSIMAQTEYEVIGLPVKLYGVDFIVYYLKLDSKADTDADGKKPCGLDKVWVTYRGFLMDDSAYQFDIATTWTPQELVSSIKAWGYVLPKFRSGVNTPVGDGVYTHTQYGSGVMFVPSGLAYHNRAMNPNDSQSTYAPLIFTFNLHDVTYTDQDADGVLDKDEFIIKDDGTFVDTDEDGIPDAFDGDDDNDGYLTKDEIKHTIIVKDGTTTPPTVLSVNTFNYPFNGAATDNPATLVDETQGIPNCSGDFTTSNRVRRHLDKNCYLPIVEEVIQ